MGSAILILRYSLQIFEFVAHIASRTIERLFVRWHRALASSGVGSVLVLHGRCENLPFEGVDK